METIDFKSGFLFARPSFIEGLARALDLGGTLNDYNYLPTTQLADNYALLKDWMIVGDDMRRVIAQMQEELPALRTNG
jgi:hypothetical protein